MGLSTTDIMQLSLDMAGFAEVPADSAVYHPVEDAERAIAGIDMDTPELFLAQQLGYDLVISHHPKGGPSTLHFPDVLDRHVEMMVEHGVGRDAAEAAMADKIYDARCRAQIANYDHAPSFARLLELGYMNVHLALDELGRRMMAATVDELSATDRVQALIDQLYASHGEFRNAGTEIDVRVGAPENPIGDVVVAHACGTNGGYPVAKAYFDHGIDTVIYIHCAGPDSRQLRDEFQAQGKNLIVTGHIASDAVGINPFLDELEARGLSVTRASGLIAST
jgi:putative NIF3 family GTP cyclohydrolase 1 type 2